MCRNERAIRRFAGDSPDGRDSLTENTQTSEEGLSANAVTNSRIHTGILAIWRDTIHTGLSDIGRAVTEQEATEISDCQSGSGTEQKKFF